jgi:SAM-dependent methyltransferase
MTPIDWDQRYAAAPEGLFGTAPNLYLRQVARRPDFAAHTALCLADGDGRNSRWLAAQGLAVTAVDLSRVAVANARALDRAAGARVTRIEADLSTWQAEPDRHYDAAFVIFFQAPWPLRRRVLQIAWAALAPGGWLALEGFSTEQAGLPGGPSSAVHLYDLSSIAAALTPHRRLEALSGRIEMDEGPRHRGEMAVVRYLAVKP